MHTQTHYLTYKFKKFMEFQKSQVKASDLKIESVWKMELPGYLQIKKEELSLDRTRSIGRDSMSSLYSNVENFSFYKGAALIREDLSESSLCPKYKQKFVFIVASLSPLKPSPSAAIKDCSDLENIQLGGYTKLGFCWEFNF